MRYLLGLGLALLFVLASIVGLRDSANASSHLTLILVDVPGISESALVEDQAKSALGIVSALSASESLAIGTFGEEMTWSGPVPSSRRNIASVAEAALDQSLSTATGRSDLLNAFTKSYELLIAESAPSGSTVFLISGADSFGMSTTEQNHLGNLFDRFNQNGWVVNTVYAPGDGTSANALSRYAEPTGGRAFEATMPKGLQKLANGLLESAGSGALVPLVQEEISQSSLLTYEVAVAPNTQRSSFLFFQDSASVTARVISPSGSEVSTSESILSIDTPLVSVWVVENPEPGQWRTRIEGSGAVTSLYNNANPLRPVLESRGPFPQHEPTIITASIRDHDSRVIADEAQYFAEVTSPSGSMAVYNLNDMGLEGDKTAGDGLYSTRIPPVVEEGSYQVTLRLRWPELDSAIVTQSRFRAEPFPRATIELLPDQRLEPGKPARIAIINVSVDGEPYPIAPDRLSASVTSFDGSQAPAELSARQLFGEGRAWSYFATITPERSGQHNLNLSLNIDYLGRQYTHFAAPLIVEVPEVPAPIQEQISSFIPPWTMAMIVIGGLAIIWFLFWLSRTGPFGYLYDDQGRQVLAFNQIERSSMARLLFKSTVNGRETGVPSLDGIAFRFTRKGVQIRNSKRAHTIRVNSQPVTGQTELSDRSWIGTQGQLFMFMPEETPEPLKFVQGDAGSVTETL